MESPCTKDRSCTGDGSPIGEPLRFGGVELDDPAQSTEALQASLCDVQAELVALQARLPRLRQRRHELLMRALAAGVSQARIAGLLGLSAGRVTQIAHERSDSNLSS
jgi:DNA-directed RNA polymerase specialized sigma24 family protein